MIIYNNMPRLTGFKYILENIASLIDVPGIRVLVSIGITYSLK